MNEVQVVSIIEWFRGIIKNNNNGDTNTTGGKDSIGSSRKKRLPLIDLRSYDAYAKCYLSFKNTTSTTASCTNQRNNSNLNDPNTTTIVHLPFESLVSGERSCELPPRNIPFAILIPSTTASCSCYNNHTNNNQSKHHHNDNTKESTTIQNNTSPILDFFFATTSKATSQSRKPWLVQQIIYENDIMWKDARDLDIYVINNDSCHNKNHDDDNDDDDGKSNYQPLPRLWKPDPMVQCTLLPLLKQKLDDDIIAFSQPYSPSSFIICDLGSGAGRDVCYLAEELQFYLHQQHQQQHKTLMQSSFITQLCIIGIDNHKGSEKRCIPFWKNRNVNHITKSLYLDLNKLKVFHQQIQLLNGGHHNDHDNDHNGVVCLYAIRFLNRKVIKAIANCKIYKKEKDNEYIDQYHHHQQQQQLQQHPKEEQCIVLKSGTLFAMSHFCKPYQGASWDFDHPKENSVLERNELYTLFTQQQNYLKEGNEEVSKKWEILHDEICLDGDHGRTLIHFVVKLL